MTYPRPHREGVLPSVLCVVLWISGVSATPSFQAAGNCLVAGGGEGIPRRGSWHPGTDFTSWPRATPRPSFPQWFPHRCQLRKRALMGALQLLDIREPHLGELARAQGAKSHIQLATLSPSVHPTSSEFNEFLRSGTVLEPGG